VTHNPIHSRELNGASEGRIGAHVRCSDKVGQSAMPIGIVPHAPAIKIEGLARDRQTDAYIGW